VLDRAEIVIIGGGIIGCSIAYHLTRMGKSDVLLLEIKRAATMAKSFGLDMSIVSAKEGQDLCPILNIDDVLAAAYLPSDGYVDPASVTQALAKGARMKGARIRQGIRVTGFERNGQRVTKVLTDQGAIDCETVVNAAGMWARELGLMMGLRVPSIAVEHQYLITDPIPDLPKAMPTFRDPDLRVYYKPEVRGIVIGGWEEGTPGFGEAGIPPEFGQQLLEGNFERFQVLAEAAFKRTPIIEKVGVRQLINGPIPFSADGEFVMGKAPELDNAFVCAGFTYGIAGGGGAGEMMAEWIVSGKPSLNLWPLDIRRFSFHHAAKQFIYPRAVDLYGKYYAVGYPRVEHHSARGIRRSPLYEILGTHGAVYGSRGGWERPNWFAPPGADRSDRPSFERPNWFAQVGAEHRAVRERAALIDQTSFSKFELSGRGAAAALQRLAAADVDKPVGSVIYTQLCNERGGIECDLTLSRLDDNHFYIVTGSAFGTHDLHWIRSHLPPDDSAVIRDVTSARAVINLCGPLARSVLEKVAEEDVGNAALPFAHCRQITLGAAAVLAVRIGYVGELGWELHIPTEYAGHVYERLWEAGQQFGIANIGYRAIDTLRMEKGYLYWSSDITPDYTPFEAGLGFRVSLKKGDFIGRDALVKAKAAGPQQRLCTFTLESFAGAVGGECILRNGKVLGVTTSGNFGHTVGKPIAYGYIPIEETAHRDFTIEVFGEPIAAIRHDGALYDSKNERLKS